MSSDEGDYMSDKYLARETEDIRPGLPKRKVDQRAFEQYKKKLRTTLPKKKEQEAINRDEGLNTAISSSNKGFQMLAKMGYKTGSSLGSTNKGIVEPIGIQLKTDKGGLGKNVKTPMTNLKQKAHAIEITREMEDNYRKNVQKKKNSQMIRGLYFKAQTSCVNLDHQHDVKLPVQEFFWPRKVLKDLQQKEKKKHQDNAGIEDDCDSEKQDEDDEEEDEEEVVNEELLVEIVEYMRNVYFYCLYCAAKATDKADLDSFCPGESYEDHDMD